MYPDLSIVWGEPIYTDGDNLSNPTILVEVLSPSTANYDAGEKFERYRQIASLQEYLMVAQDAQQLIHCIRQTDGSWLLREYTDAQTVLQLPSIDCQLNMEDIYDKAI